MGPARRWQWASAVLGASLGACADAPPVESGSGTGPTSSGPTAASIDSTTAGSTTLGVAVPEVIDLGQDVSVLREGESVILTAVVADDDDDVVMGELWGPGEPASYGAFTQQPSRRWRAVVSWNGVRERMSLSFEQQLDLPFVARFVDAAGHEAEAEITLQAVCSGVLGTACDGVCVDVQGDVEHCGQCGRACVPVQSLDGADPSGGCAGSVCQPWWSGCIRPDPSGRAQTCAEQCAALGARCDAYSCAGAAQIPSTVMIYPDDGLCEQDVAVPAEPSGACDDDFAQWGSAAALRCCCR